MLARAAGPSSPLSLALDPHLDQPAILQQVLTLLKEPSGWVDWSAPSVSRLYKLCLHQALLAHGLAHSLPGCDPEKAWTASLLSPLGWLAACAIAPDQVGERLNAAGRVLPLDVLDPDTLGRRLARLWRLPGWLTSVISYQGMNVGTAQRLGADPLLFQIVQLAVALVQREENLFLGTPHQDVQTLQAALGWSLEFVEHQQDQARLAVERHLATPQIWNPPSSQPLLVDLLELAIQNRKPKDQELIEQLQREIDQFQRTLEDQQQAEKDRLQALKLSSLAELAAGAGHEINNPLAVISGQAQYSLKQIQQAEDELVEDTHALAVLSGLRGKVERSLHTIVGQVQRVHQVLTDLMHFARPASPRRQAVRLRDLLQEVVQAAQSLADNRKVRLVFVEPPENWQVQVDLGQVRLALLGLLRNAIEAAPAEGWAGLRAEARGGAVGVIIEDNGQGPTSLAQEHMFDPFFSGRNAGRGRGLGLSTAWRLARQHGGDVGFEGMVQGTTRFALTLPDLELAEPPRHSNGKTQQPETALNGSH